MTDRLDIFLIRKIAILAFFVAIVWVLFTLAKAQAQSQVVCGPYVGITKSINSAYGETLAGYGTTSSGLWRIELWRRTDNDRSWTLLAVGTSGNTCIASSGIEWEEISSGKHINDYEK